MKKLLLVVFALTALSALSLAASVRAVSPVLQEMRGMQGEVLDLGLVGPGQTFELDVSRSTGELAKFVSSPTEAKWDKLFVYSVPDGWSSEDSKFYEEPLRAFVTVAKDAEDGEYSLKFRVFDEYEGTPPMEFNAKITVSKNVLELEVPEKRIVTGVGQPAVYFVRLKNKSSASDAFDLTASGLPAGWKYSQRVFVPLKNEVLVPFEVLASDQGEFNFAFQAVSMSSPAITASDTAVLVTESSLLLDLQAASKGVLLFPGIEQTVYSLLAFIGTLV